MEGDVERRMRVLIVDDDRETRETLRDVFDELGHGALCATDGQEALELLRREPDIDFVLLDLLMPGMDGYEFRRHQLADSELATVPVVVFSGDGEARDRLADSPPVAVLTKPIKFTDLLAALELGDQAERAGITDRVPDRDRSRSW